MVAAFTNSYFLRSLRARLAGAERAFGALLFASLMACQPGIGDECETSADCSASGDRLCDITQPGGYCTLFNCEPGTCPEDAVCVLFGASRSTVAGCEEPYGASPYQRSFCLKTCGGSGDCRSGYGCVNVGAADNPWSAVVVDSGESGKVCIVPYKSELPDDRSGEVCSGTSGELQYPPDGGTSEAGGASGAGGEAGQGGAAGALSSGGGAGGA